MDIEQVNATLNRAIESFQESELAMLWEFSVSTPHEMHRKVGMRLPKGALVVPDPEQVAGRGGGVDAAYAKAHAITNPAEFGKVFDKLRPKQVVWVSFSSSISGNKTYRPFIVGRRGHSKKYNMKSLTLLGQEQKRPGPSGMQPKLLKRGKRDVSMALGDMAASLHGLYAQKS